LDSEISGIFSSAGSDIDDGEAAGRSIQLAGASMMGQPATAMLAQANLSPETVFNLLQA
jgi:flagellin-like hook-associated protein FlgL